MLTLESPDQYRTLRAQLDVHNAEVDARFRDKPTGWASYKPDDLEHYAPTNDERSAIEVYEFVRDKPERYFAYVELNARTVTTWTGQKLGTITRIGREYRDAFGGQRIPITVQGINGVRYHGIYFVSSGDYCRLRAYKSQTI